MPQIVFTARTIESLEPQIGKRLEFWDKSLPRFGLRITESGIKTWVVMYRPNGSRVLRRLTLGRYPFLSLADAREKAWVTLRDVALGGDPVVDRIKARRTETFTELADCYLKEHAMKKKKSWKEDHRLIYRELIPTLRKYKAKEVSRRDIRGVLTNIVDRGAPIQANRVLALARKIFNFGVQEEIVDINPCWKIPAPSRERQRDRVLNPEEIKRLWDCLSLHSTNVRLFFKLVLLTAQRPGEVLRMSWSEIDFSAGWWTIPAERAKNNLSHRVALSRPAKLLLLEQKLLVADSPWVLPSHCRKNHVTEIKQALKVIRSQTDMQFIPRDLRRTAASHMTSIGISRFIVKKVLNHKEREVTAVYDRYSYDSEKREATEKWSETLLSFAQPESGTKSTARSI